MLVLAGVGVASTVQPIVDGRYLVDTWTVDDGLPLDHVTDVAVGPDGEIWVSSMEGIVRFDGHTFHDVPLADVGSQRFHRLHADGDVLWALSISQVVVRIEGLPEIAARRRA